MPDVPRHRRRDSRPTGMLVAIVVVGCLLVGSSAALLVSRVRPSTASATPTPTTPSSKAPLNVVSTDPAPGATGVPLDAEVSVHFTTALSDDSPLPTLSPALPGTWVRSGPDTLGFEAAGTLPPGTSVTVSVPGGPTGIEGSGDQRLGQALHLAFTTAPMSTLRLQQLLAQLDYLPVSFTPADPSPVVPKEMAVAQLGSFSWRWSTLPGAFMALWSPGVSNVVTQGAVMTFESQHGLPTDGVAGPKVWDALLLAAAEGQTNTYGHYDFVEVSTSSPEHADVWRDGQIAYSTLANTGIEAAPTEVGTWPVYARYVTTTMSGTNPDGSHYRDPGIPWVSYFHGGDALHGFIRSSYGSPQSLGCVELPPAHAAVVYPYTPIGTLVTIN
ncbi:MAG TPA: L,D-transpeptidase family protein [Acidimicrobiales bacterium]|nr:L,D-transpeptidase family protein [Acidimicrobiales bacterium]